MSALKKSTGNLCKPKTQCDLINNQHRGDKIAKVQEMTSSTMTYTDGERADQKHIIRSDLNRVKAYPFSISKLSSLSEIKDCKEFRFS